MTLTLIQKVISGVAGAALLALAVACGILYLQNQSKDEKIELQAGQITTLQSAVAAKDLLINEKTMSSNLADLLAQERRTADEVLASYRRETRAALKDLVLKDEDVRKWLADLWPAPVLQLLDQTRDRLFPGNSAVKRTEGSATGNAVPAKSR